jgi:hypothetical protein
VRVDQLELRVIKEDKDHRQLVLKEDKEQEELKDHRQSELKDLRVLLEHKDHHQSEQ